MTSLLPLIGGVPAEGGAPANPMVVFFPYLLIIFIFYFMLIRPQQKKAKEHKQMVEALRRKDDVLLQSGIFGKVTKVTDGEDEIEVEIAKDVKVRVLRSAIASVTSKSDPA